MVCTCFLFLQSIHAQNARCFENIYSTLDSTRSEGDLLLRISDVNFFYNDEYFSDYIEGYTLVGYRLQPSLVYYLRKPQTDSTDGAISLEVGCQMLQFGGTNKYDNVFPVATARWQMNRVWQLVMGTIDGHAYHLLPESMWEIERQLVDKPEVGVQMKFEHQTLSGEVWLNWQQFIKRYDSIPEKFTAGIRVDWQPKTNSDLYFKMPVRLLFSHIGGQISDYNERMQSLTNGMLAVEIGMHRRECSSSRNIYFDIESQFYHAMVDKGVRPFSDGFAIHPKICYNAEWNDRLSLDANVGFWKAKKYFSLYGNPSYMSLSNYKEDIYSPKRNMLTFDVDLGYMLSDVMRFTVGGKGYFDTDANQFDYAYRIALVLTPQWRIATLPRLLNTINR